MYVRHLPFAHFVPQRFRGKRVVTFVPGEGGPELRFAIDVSDKLTPMEESFIKSYFRGWKNAFTVTFPHENPS